MRVKPGTFKCACAIDSITNQYHTVFNDYYYCMCRKLINNVFSFVVTATRLGRADCVQGYADMFVEESFTAFNITANFNEDQCSLPCVHMLVVTYILIYCDKQVPAISYVYTNFNF